MQSAAARAVDDIDAFLRTQSERPLLRFITCGSVDDGKSTLIGRLLYESKLLFDDQLATLETESRRSGTQGGGLDFALLVDGLAAEREQGITIDVAYRYFNTARRKFIVADTPGHEQYTRNMATGASTCDVAVILIDARKGVLTQTRRHSVIVSMLGVRHIVLAVNKMDLVGYSELAFAKIERDYIQFAQKLGFADITAIPLSALKGDNVVTSSGAMPWYRGRPLLETLETIDVEADAAAQPFRMPVQWVNRPNPDFRGYAGLITSGTVWVGDRIRIEPSGKESKVARIVTQGGDLERAVAGQSITLVLNDEIDISRGDLITSAAETAETARQLEARLLWLNERPFAADRPYLLKVGTKTVGASGATPEQLIDIHTLERKAATNLGMNEVGVVALKLDRPIAFDAYARNRETGSFILIDRETNDTVGMGFIERRLEGATLVAANDETREAGGMVSAWLATLRRQRSLTVFGLTLVIRLLPQPARERVWRSLGKAISWRTVGTIDTLILAYIFTGDHKATIAIGLTELLTKTFLYYFHERIWARIRLGVREKKA